MLMRIFADPLASGAPRRRRPCLAMPHAAEKLADVVERPRPKKAA